MTLPGQLETLLTGYRRGWEQYADFSGITGWGEYFSFFAINLSVGLSLQVLELMAGNGLFEVLGILYGLVALIPGMAITVRLMRHVFS